MKKLAVVVKQISFLAVPLSLVLSIYLNSLVCILFLLVFLPDLLRNCRKHDIKLKRRIFLVLLAFVGTYFLGFVIDIGYGIVNIKKMQRLLPFLIFPLILLFANPLNRFTDARTPALVFAFFIGICNFVLMGNLLVGTWKEYNNTGLDSARWQRSNLRTTQDNTDLPNPSILNTTLISGVPGNERYDLLYNRFFKVDRDTMMTRSVYVKSDDDLWLLVRHFDGERHRGAWFHPKEGKLGFVQREIEADIWEAGNGWYRVSVTNHIPKTTVRERLQLTFVDGNKSYVYAHNRPFEVALAGDQLEFGSAATQYRPFVHRDFWERFDRSKALEPINGHPTYYSLYLLLTTLFLFYFLPNSILKFFLLLGNTIFLILLGSKACLLTLIILLVMIGMDNVKKGKPRMNWMIGALLLGGSASLILLPNPLDRFNQTLHALTGNSEETLLSTDQRLHMWGSLLELPIWRLVLGNGHIHSYTILDTGMSFNLNMHNQYLEALLTSGVFGLFLLLVFLFGIFLVDYRAKKNILLVLFVTMLALNLVFENVLNRQWGIVFAAYFLPYLYLLQKEEHEQ